MAFSFGYMNIFNHQTKRLPAAHSNMGINDIGGFI